MRDTGLTRLKKIVAAALALLLLLGAAMPALAEAFSAAVSAKAATVYEDAALTQAVGTLGRRTIVVVESFSDGVARIRSEGGSGYVAVSDLLAVDAFARKALLNRAASVYLEPDAASAHVAAKKGAKVYVLAAAGDWAMIERGGVVGYVALDALTEADDSWKPLAQEREAVASGAVAAEQTATGTPATVTADSLKVYQKASTTSTKLGTLKKGQAVNLIQVSGSWAYIELNGKYGYCAASGVAEVGATPSPAPTATPSPEATAQASVQAKATKSLKVYKKASTTSKKLGTLKKNQVVNVLTWNKKWAYIELNGNKGYCLISGLKKVTESPTVAPTEEPVVRTVTVANASVTVYKKASTSSTKLGTLKKGVEVKVLSESGKWAYIEYNGKKGYCKLSALTSEEKLPTGYAKGGFAATVVYPGAKVYSSPSTGAQSAAIALGASVNVYAYSADWAIVTRDKGYGCIPVQYLSRKSYELIAGDGEALEALLKALLGGGYYDAVPSKNYNAAAISAIKRFQAACGLSETGEADESTQRILYGGYAPVSGLLSKALSKGDSGESVSRVQARLYALGYLSRTNSLDGDYGATTAAAVKLFQSANGLSADGAASVATLKALYSVSAKGLPSGTKAADATTATTTTTSTTYLDAVPTGLASTTSAYSEGMSNAEKLEYVIYLAQNQLGKPYVYGAAGPDKYDCSGLTTYIFKKIGISLERSAYSQGYDNTYTKIEGAANLKRGDLVYFNTISDSDLSDHAGIYIGNGYFIHASSGGHRVVVSNLTVGYYSRVFSWGRRILG